ncbi:transcription factor spTFIIE alpha subunit [Histoplasma capsulatum G186AR]|uniref:Transcription factor spTFIIE alpha subunit n=2 Tax=Ajellomyces capsulatus TaxID=5037 RepID=C0NM45_AJECG|nr:transcription factor spTFIIE alpha subunit [Histoplasma capsulatum G186AR]EEH07696.1 transcription factor spTFIIE alpha subunit [Histoplasma capsulatum G186AR]KAG5304164.1 transcription factor spTFIIE alpha subunit [Histoplasma capsulatum]QSS69763.1 transcription factor spTFIIE alpha subunit [Histoplasma capsulatum G186AR]
MDLASSLIRTVVRAFYETRHILVIDALFIHSVLHPEDLAHLLGMQQKDLRKLCARLREDRLIAVHSRPEIRDGQTRPVNREYYYIPLYPVVDAIKYRVSRLTSIIKAQYTPTAERKEYVCTRCGAEWTQLEVLSRIGPDGFECHRCGATLERADEVEGGTGADRTGHEKNSKLMAQLDKMLKLLKQIDSVDVPENDFETAWEHKVDVIRNQYTNPTRPGVAYTSNRQAAVRGISKTDASSLEVSLTSSAEKSAAEQAEEAARKAALEKQNALPVWHTHSTVKSEPGNLPVKHEPNGITDVFAIKSEVKEEQKPDIDALDDKVAAYYAEMAREKEREAKDDVSSVEESSDEEEDEFEDVGVAPGVSETPAVAEGNNTPKFPNGSLKREMESDSGSSAPQTGAATPDTTAEDGPPAKRVKFEPQVKREAVSDEDEDDEEFEDV